MFAAAFASPSASLFSVLGIYWRVNPLNLRSSPLTTVKYLANFGLWARYSFSTCPATTWEFVLISKFFAPKAFALLSSRMNSSYSAILFVALKSSLVAYFDLRPDGAIRTADAPTPAYPQALFVNSVHV